MIRNSIIGAFAVLACILPWSLSAATKPAFQICSNCHTMHFSQDGVLDRGGGAGIQGAGTGVCMDCHAQYRAVLLKLDCVGCHANVNSGSNIDPVTKAPLIAHNAAADLAGGNFRYVFNINDAKGHNVHGFGLNIQSGDLANIPPGYNAAYDPSSLKYDQFNAVGQIMCGGQNGCHGNRDRQSQIDAVKGAHHEDDTVLKFGTINEAQQGPTSGTNGERVGRSYRFLMGVKGGEETDWEGNSPTATKHNEYKGSTAAHANSQTWSDVDTISEFCAECHGDFHSAAGMGTSNPWMRHPTDVVLPATGEFSSYATYSLTAPVARVVIPNAPESLVQSGTPVVMCLSCHRAHASNYYKALRWDYRNANLGTALSGCTVCHTSMN